MHHLENLTAASESRECGPVIVHELPRRLRVKIALLKCPHLDLEQFAHLISDLAGLTSVRGGAGARSAIIEYDGASAASCAILQKLSAITPHDLRLHRACSDEEPSIAPLGLPLICLLSLALIPAPFTRLLTWVAISPRGFRSAHPPVTKGRHGVGPRCGPCFPRCDARQICHGARDRYNDGERRLYRANRQAPLRGSARASALRHPHFVWSRA